MKNLCLILLFIIGTNLVFSFENISIPSDNIVTEAQFNILNEEIEELEKQIVKKSYRNEPTKKRLSRLEKEIFGMEQKGNEQERFENLQTAAQYYKDGYRANETQLPENNNAQYYTYENSNNIIQNKNPQNSYTSSYYADDTYNQGTNPQKIQKQSKVKQFFSDLADILTTGVATGYTPPIYYDNFDSLGGADIIGYPQFPIYRPSPQTYYYNRPYIPHTVYNPPYYPRYNYHRPTIPPPNYIYRNRPVYHHPGAGARTYKTGSRVKIIN